MEIRDVSELIDSIPSRVTLIRLFTVINLLCVIILTKYSIDLMITDQLIPSKLDFTSIGEFVVSGQILIPVLTFILIWVLTRGASTIIGQRYIGKIHKYSSTYHAQVDKIKSMNIKERKKYFNDNSDSTVVKIFMPFFDGHEIERLLRSKDKSDWISLIHDLKTVVLVCFDPLLRMVLSIVVVKISEPIFPTILFVLFFVFVVFAFLYIYVLYSFLDILSRYISPIDKNQT